MTIPQVDEGMIWESGKTYVHSVGLSCAFRQWKAESHCKFIHGYSLQVACTFRSKDLDVRGWLVDFGSLKSFKGWLEDIFDHKTLVAEDDPLLSEFQRIEQLGGMQLSILPHVGMEATAYYIYHYLDQWLIDNGYSKIILQEVEVKEHESNWARYRRHSS